MQEVTLSQMLEARERRVQEQQRLLREFSRPVICFTMNIPGPIKDSPLIRRGFSAGCEALNHRLPKHRILFSSAQCDVTGCQALYAVDLDALSLKQISTAIEEETRLGRLFDMDVLDTDGRKLDRELVGGKSRACIVCGAAGKGCASRRSHSVAQLQKAANQILTSHFAQEDSNHLGTWAVESLLEEACTTPKPGLVDCRNTGSHRDMDLFTFLASAAALAPYFCRCAEIGMETSAGAPEETFRQLRAAGLQAEQDMEKATNGVNTHRGAVFILGILCGAAGRLWNPVEGWTEKPLFSEVAAMTADAMAEDLRQPLWDTAGLRLYAQTGISGVRGEVAQGLPSVEKIGLPVYRACLEEGLSQNDAGSVTLLHLIAQVEDTNMLRRGGASGAAAGAAWAGELIRNGRRPTRAELEELDERFIQCNLSPGGCADLLSAVYFVSKLLEKSTKPGWSL